VLGERHTFTALTSWRLADVHSQLGDKSQTLELVGKAHAIFLATYGPDHAFGTIMAKNAA
jgi:hypothetical protein